MTSMIDRIHIPANVDYGPIHRFRQLRDVKQASIGKLDRDAGDSMPLFSVPKPPSQMSKKSRLV